MFKQVNAGYHHLHRDWDQKNRERSRRPAPPATERGRADGGNAHSNAAPKGDWWAEEERRTQELMENRCIAIVGFAAGQAAGHLSYWKNWADAAGPWTDVLPIPFSVAVGVVIGVLTMITTIIGLTILRTTPWKPE